MSRSGPTRGNLVTISAGKSEWSSTPTRSSAAPSTQTISVLEQVRETIRTALSRGTLRILTETVADPSEKSDASAKTAWVVTWIAYATYYTGRKGFSVAKKVIE